MRASWSLVKIEEAVDVLACGGGVFPKPETSEKKALFRWSLKLLQGFVLVQNKHKPQCICTGEGGFGKGEGCKVEVFFSTGMSLAYR